MMVKIPSKFWCSPPQSLQPNCRSVELKSRIQKTDSCPPFCPVILQLQCDEFYQMPLGGVVLSGSLYT